MCRRFVRLEGGGFFGSQWFDAGNEFRGPWSKARAPGWSGNPISRSWGARAYESFDQAIECVFARKTRWWNDALVIVDGDGGEDEDEEAVRRVEWGGGLKRRRGYETRRFLFDTLRKGYLTGA